jgi:hypothetical protein
VHMLKRLSAPALTAVLLMINHLSSHGGHRRGKIMNLVNQEHRTTGQHRALFRRTVRLAVVLALAIFAGLAVGAAPAQARVIGPNLYTWQNVHTSRCLADSFAGGLQVLACSSAATQQWQDITPPASTYQFRNVHTSRCLADSFAGGLQVLPCASPDTQDWR